MQSRPTGQALPALGLPARAVSSLAAAGVTTVEDLAGLTRRELAGIKGLGPGMIAAIRRVVPEPGTPHPIEDEAPAAPPIPSFASLREPRRRSAVDLLVPGAPPVAAEPSPPSPPSPAPRPAEYADLLRLAVRLVRWSVREPVRCLGRLLGR
ncbi:DNA-directed RNA polymerase subunit alpha C-terminal domain-containing protein [Geodermatophilus sp. URMC 64]